MSIRRRCGWPTGSLPQKAPTRRATVRNAGTGRRTEGYAYVFPKRDHVNVGIGYVLQHYRDAIEEAPYSCSGGSSIICATRGMVERRVGPAPFHAVHDSGRRAAAPTRPRPRAAGRRRRRVRQRLHGRRDLLRDGVRRPGRPGDRLDTTPRRLRLAGHAYRRACDAEMGRSCANRC